MRVKSLLLSSFCCFLLNLFCFADANLILHLRFDEGSGEIAQDSSGRGNHAKLHNPLWEQYGLQGAALRFDGESTYVKLPQSEDFDNLLSFSFSLWFKATDFNCGMSLFSRGSYNDGWSTYIFRSFVAMSGKALGKAPVLYTRFTAGDQAMLPYYHLFITGAPSKENPENMAVRYYVNGELRRSREGVEEFITDAFLPSPPNKSISIGQFRDNSSQWFKGIIDEVRIYNKTLEPNEIKDLYTEGLKPALHANSGEKPLLQARDFPPLQRKRLAIYQIPEEYGIKPVMPLEWFEEQAAVLGVRSRRLGNAEVSDHKLLHPDNFDTLLLPVVAMPLECEDSIFKFMAAGGNVLALSMVPDVFNLDEQGQVLRNKQGKIIFKQHRRGWYAPFLVRHLDPGWGWSLRKVVMPLTLNPAVAKITGDCLPAEFPADPTLRYTPLDNRTNYAKGDGGYGKGDNYAQAQDLKVELYLEPNGVGADFCAYRYYNKLIFGAGFVEFGKVGTKLLQGENGVQIFKAALYLLESELPGQQSEQYYRQIVQLNQDWSDFGFLYFETLATLRDAGIAAMLKSGDYQVWQQKLGELVGQFESLWARRKEQEQQLLHRAEPDKISAAVQSLLQDVAAAQTRFLQFQAEAKQLLAGVNSPAKVAVQHKYGTIPSIASLTLPMNLNRLRGRLFDGIRKVEANVFSGSPFHSWYANDKLVQQAMHGIARDHKFVYAASPHYVLGGGKFNPSNGSVSEAEPVEYPFEKIKDYVQKIVDDWSWKGEGNFRIGSCSETGIGYNYWGAAAAEDLRNHLRSYYKNDLAALNKHWGSDYKSFEEIKLPTRKAESASQHALWEHWRCMREAKLESLYANYRDIVKKINPQLDVFQLPSTGALQSPLYGVNFYNATKYQDVNGIDGTCCSSNYEWIYADLTRVRTHTSEWGGLYTEATLPYVNAQLWKELSAGALGFEQHVWSFGSCSVNFVDVLDQPQLYAALLRMVLRDARKLDHLILDGQRAEPEIGILFSQTARQHDQGWGWGGEKTESRHMSSVANYYELFLQFHRSARVIAEEMLLEGEAPPLALMFVPQAGFLSEATQRCLLGYAESGGILVCEGSCGEFDEFGQDSYWLFK